MKAIAATAAREEVAAIVAAMERFARSTMTPAVSVALDREPWQRAAVLEGVEREPRVDGPDPWILAGSSPWINT
jgi:hypothetical protein